MSHRTRIEQTLSGEQPDRPPVALWRHFPVDDQDPDRLASAHILFQKTYDFDLLKVTPESGYMASGWGNRTAWRGNPEGTREYLQRAVSRPEDWDGLARLDAHGDSLRGQLRCLKKIRSAVGPDVPILMTIFSPMGQARKLAGETALLEHLRLYPDSLMAGLETITRTTVDFIEALSQTGIDGIFYALQFAQYAKISEHEFDRFCMPYHRRVLEAAGGFWLNMLHLHGQNVMFEKAVQLPAQVLNWHDLEGGPDLRTGQERFAGVVCGGLRQWDTMVYGDPDQVRREAQAAIERTGGRRFLLGTGCVTPITAPHGNLTAARRSVEN